MRELSIDEVRKYAPSVFAETPHNEMSERYAMIPTIQVLEALRKEGYVPTRVNQSIARSEERRAHTKHMVRLRHLDDMNRPAVVDAVVPEVVLVNSHDGTSSYQLHAGLFRFVCTNGLVVPDVMYEKQCIRHSGNVIDNVIEGVYRVVRDTPEITSRVDVYRGVSMTPAESMILANAALQLKYGDEAAPIQAEQLLRPRRSADTQNNLWVRFNSIQENLIQGGLRGRNSLGRPTTTRAVKSVNEDIRLNKALWLLTDEFAKLKATAH